MIEIFSQFNTKGAVNDLKPYGNGHINNTFLVEAEKRYILQQINPNVFKNPKEVMHNINLVTSFLKKNAKNPNEVLSLVLTKDGNPYFEDKAGCLWRLYDFVEDSVCLDRPETEKDFYQAAVAFGRFQKLLGDFSASDLYETIPDFHNTPDRYKKFLNAVEKDVCSRVGEVGKEIEFIKKRADFYSTLFDSNIPLRVAHNDTKMNNVMLKADTREALCVIDLDTVMPGFSVTDFGDSIRFGASTAPEDEKDLDKVSMDLRLFEIYVEGFIKGADGLLTKDEILLMPEGAKMMTIECGMRFLTDYLEGDTYFKTKYPDHNLDRCRTQLKLVWDMESKWDKMKEIVKKFI